MSSRARTRSQTPRATTPSRSTAVTNGNVVRPHPDAAVAAIIRQRAALWRDVQLKVDPVFSTMKTVFNYEKKITHSVQPHDHCYEEYLPPLAELFKLRRISINGPFPELLGTRGPYCNLASRKKECHTSSVPAFLYKHPDIICQRSQGKNLPTFIFRWTLKLDTDGRVQLKPMTCWLCYTNVWSHCTAMSKSLYYRPSPTGSGVEIPKPPAADRDRETTSPLSSAASNSPTPGARPNPTSFRPSANLVNPSTDLERTGADPSLASFTSTTHPKPIRQLSAPVSPVVSPPKANARAASMVAFEEPDPKRLPPSNRQSTPENTFAKNPAPVLTTLRPLRLGRTYMAKLKAERSAGSAGTPEDDAEQAQVPTIVIDKEKIVEKVDIKPPVRPNIAKPPPLLDVASQPPTAAPPIDSVPHSKEEFDTLDLDIRRSLSQSVERGSLLHHALSNDESNIIIKLNTIRHLYDSLIDVATSDRAALLAVRLERDKAQQAAKALEATYTAQTAALNTITQAKVEVDSQLAFVQRSVTEANEQREAMSQMWTEACKAREQADQDAAVANAMARKDRSALVEAHAAMEDAFDELETIYPQYEALVREVADLRQRIAELTPVNEDSNTTDHGSSGVTDQHTHVAPATTSPQALTPSQAFRGLSQSPSKAERVRTAFHPPLLHPSPLRPSPSPNTHTEPAPAAAQTPAKPLPTGPVPVLATEHVAAAAAGQSSDADRSHTHSPFPPTVAGPLPAPPAVAAQPGRQTDIDHPPERSATADVLPLEQRPPTTPEASPQSPKMPASWVSKKAKGRTPHKLNIN